MSTTCVSAFATYTGSTYDNQSGLDFGLFYPLPEAWSTGERDVLCYVFYTDGRKLTGSLRNAGGSIPPSS